MAPTYLSPKINSILSDYRFNALVPEGQYSVLFGSDRFKITVHDYTNLFFHPVNSNGDPGVIFIFPDYYRYGEMPGINYDPTDPQLHEKDLTVSLCPHILEVEENCPAIEDSYRIIVMKAVQVLDDDGSLIYPDGHTIPHGKPLDVVEMSWE